MGTSTNALLMYGYELNTADGWNVREVDEDGYLTPAWAADDEDFAAAAERVLLAANGFTESDRQADSDLERAAKKRLGVEIAFHVHIDCPGHILAAKTITAHRGYPEQVDFAALTEQAFVENWDGKLAAALAALGLTPKQDRPRWILASYWA